MSPNGEHNFWGTVLAEALRNARKHEEGSLVRVTIDPEELAPVIAATVKATLDAIQADQDRLGPRLAFSELEAAKLLGLERHVLRDCRLRGEIAFCRLANRRIAYERSALLDYLASHREEARV